MNNRHMRNLSLLASASVAALVFFTAGCNRKDASKATAGPSSAPWLSVRNPLPAKFSDNGPLFIRKNASI